MSRGMFNKRFSNTDNVKVIRGGGTAFRCISTSHRHNTLVFIIVKELFELFSGENDTVLVGPVTVIHRPETE
jgi:hypothetical protein